MYLTISRYVYTSVGVVIRQGLKSTIVQYTGVVVGALANLFLYTQLTAEYGLVQILIVIANVILPFAMLGSYSLAVRFYPRFTEPDAGKQGFLTLLLLVATVGISLYLVLNPLLEPWLRDFYLGETRADYRQYIRYVPALVFCIAFIKVLFQYTSNFRRIVVPTLLEQFLFKLSLPLLLLAFLWGYFTIEQVVQGVVLNYGLALLGMLVYLWSLGELRLVRPTREVLGAWKAMSGFAGYGIASMLGTALAFRVDAIMVAAYLGFEAAGQYTIVLFIADVIAKPYTNVRSVLAPEISKAWVDKNTSKLQALYQQSSLNLTLICGYLLGGIIVCYPSLTQLATKGEVLATAFGAFVLLGLSRLIDSATSINEYIISFSSKYRFNLVAILLLAGVNIGLNTYLIPRYGITGAGLATLLSIGLYNAAKVLFAGLQFKLWPFGKTSLVILLTLAVCTLAVYKLPMLDIWYLDIPLRGGLFTIFVGLYVWFAKPSEQVDQIRKQVLTSVFKR